ncbi:NAD(P)-binding protein [Laetiporus sulphureus 93-53]|uniref:NAD(P)-binding protein n=1 Tax=Laetiporus sulphureus 93-53 TaxID=1314785 RepID=A0A165CR23_9APHY|nr:NAD(P)-binding protein [Laetiporus sulphureus 93-53]KZT03270.1 NAD(P)-binding protein [Laetiporus sulphureus 93-53]
MAASKTSIFLTGAAGYISGTVLAHLLRHPDVGTFDITALVRSPEKARKLEAFGVRSVVGSLDDFDKLEALSEQADVVFSCADSDYLPAMQAILRGLKKRHESLGDLPILIHTSGTGVLSEDTRGMYVADKVYSDLDVEQLKAIPETAIHRKVDLAVIAADQQEYARTHIVFPSQIHGVANHALVEAGISNPYSIAIPWMILAAIQRKQGGVVGLGKSVWPDVDIDDVADLYVVLFDAIRRDPEHVGHGWEGFYFAENGEYCWYDLTKAVVTALVELGAIENDEISSFTEEELPKYFRAEANGWLFGSTSRCRADRGRSIGWKPVKKTEDMYAGVKVEAEVLWRKKF